MRADASLNSVVKVTLAKLDEQPTAEPVKKVGGPVNQSVRIATDPDAALVRHASGKSYPLSLIHI